jgi:hypothetical protein
MSIEGFIDFCIFGYLNMVTAEFNMDGEILGFSFGLFSLVMSVVIMPLTIIILVCTKT